MTDKLTKRKISNRLKELEVYNPPSSTVYTTARQLYETGFNVFPIPTADQWRLLAEHKDDGTPSKPPYILQPFFSNRLHVCTQACVDRVTRTGRTCLPQSATFSALFDDRSNLAGMMGRTSHNLTNLDCDTLEAFDQLQDELDNRSIPYIAYISSRGGSYLVRVQQGEVNNIGHDQCKIPGVEVWGNSHYAVLPPSFHPTGCQYLWVTPHDQLPQAVGVAELAFLGVTLRKVRKPRKWQEPELVNNLPWTKHLSLANRRILKAALAEGTRNTNLTKPLYDLAALVQQGVVHYWDAYSLLEETAQRCNYPEKQLRQMWKSATRKPGLTRAVEYYGGCAAGGAKGSTTTTTTTTTTQNALEWAISRKWTGRTAQTDRKVFLAVVDIATRCGLDTFHATCREVAELAGCGRKAAMNALDRLRKPEGPLQVVTLDTGGAIIYRFRLETIIAQETPLSYTVVKSGVSCAILETQHLRMPEYQDAFNRHPVAGRVWKHLCNSPEKSVKAIAERTRMNYGSVLRAVRWLESYDLVYRYDRLYIGRMRDQDGLRAVAQLRGTDGLAERRKDQHKLEREVRANIQVLRAKENWWRDYQRVKNGIPD